MTQLDINQLDEAAMLAVAAKLAASLQPGTIYLEGNLGAGKTTFSRGLIQGLGHVGAVKSPTFTLVEPYQLGELAVYHFDLYRLNEPDELDYIGARDYFSGDSLCVIEWPSLGEGYIPQADLHIHINRRQADSRDMCFTAHSDLGKAILAALDA